MIHITNAIREAIRCYLIGSRGIRPKNGFYLTVHPETTYQLMQTSKWRVEFNGDKITKHWEQMTVIEDVGMQIGHFKITTEKQYEN